MQPWIQILPSQAQFWKTRGLTPLLLPLLFELNTLSSANTSCSSLKPIQLKMKLSRNIIDWQQAMRKSNTDLYHKGDHKNITLKQKMVVREVYEKALLSLFRLNRFWYVVFNASFQIIDNYYFSCNWLYKAVKQAKLTEDSYCRDSTLESMCTPRVRMLWLQSELLSLRRRFRSEPDGKPHGCCNT